MKSKNRPLLAEIRNKVYAVGPTQTIANSEAYTNLGGSPWATSNVMAKVAGITKTNTSVFPEARGNGYCARLDYPHGERKGVRYSRYHCACSRFDVSRNGTRTHQEYKEPEQDSANGYSVY